MLSERWVWTFPQMVIHLVLVCSLKEKSYDLHFKLNIISIIFSGEILSCFFSGWSFHLLSSKEFTFYQLASIEQTLLWTTGFNVVV